MFDDDVIKSEDDEKIVLRSNMIHDYDESKCLLVSKLLSYVIHFFGNVESICDIRIYRCVMFET